MLSAENVTTSDPDRFIIKTDDDGGLWLALADGVSLNHEDAATVDVTVTVTDDHGATAETVVTITVNNVDEAPDAPTATPSAANLTVAENDGGGVNLAQLTSHDPEEDEISYAVDNEDFEIEVVGAAVLLKVKDGVELDYEATMDGTITLMVTASDPAGNTSEGTAVVVTVTDVNEAPTISFADSTIFENETGSVGRIINDDPESGLSDFPFTVLKNTDGGYVVTDFAGNSLTFTVSDSRFSVEEDPLVGLVLFLNEGVDADMEGGDSITVTVTVTDGEHTAMTEATITVTNVNEAPTIVLMDGKVPDGGPDDAVGPYASSTINENSTGPVAQIDVSDQEETLTEAHVTVDDDRFEIRPDHLGGLWLFLKDAVNHEEVGSIDVTVTVTDSGDATAMVEDYTITIRDVNDAPTSGGLLVRTADATDEEPKMTDQMDNLAVTAGGSISETIELGDMFSDEDGESNFRYTLEDAPTWLKLINVIYHDDGSVTGELVGAVPAGNDISVVGVKIVATDDGGPGDEPASGSASFNVIVDDGNDAITRITLANTDGTANSFFDVEVEENDGSGMVIGKLTAHDDDNPLHPNGQHTWKVDDARFEVLEDGTLKVKDEMMLDHESQDDQFNFIDSFAIMVTATDGGGTNESSRTQQIIVQVGDNNDAPYVENEPGNWWVTIDDDIDAEDATAGQWLKFGLETDDGDGNRTTGDLRPLFKDQDLADDEELVYSIVSGPAWLEIDKNTGEFQNVEKMVAERGVYDVTVRATDKAGASADASFKIAVVLSGVDAADGDKDNDDPNIQNSQGIDIPEKSAAGTVVATFTVTDDDLDLEGIHPWGKVKVDITSLQNTEDSGSPVEEQDAAALAGPGKYLELVKVSEDDNSITYNVQLTTDGAGHFNHEAYDDVRITVVASDGIDGNDDTDTINFDITDVNEAPVYLRDADTSSEFTDEATKSILVEQQAPAVQTIYLNLTKLFNDPDDDHDDDDLSFSVDLSDTPYLTMLHGPGAWEVINEGPDGDGGTDDDVGWGDTLTAPDDDDIVVILQIDRTGIANDAAEQDAQMLDATEITQDANGQITITARDEDGASSTTNIAVTVTDENLAPAGTAKGVTLTDTSLYQSDRLNMRFDPSVDPDLTGDEADSDSPVATIYKWISDDGTTETERSASVDNPSTYTVIQDDVGSTIEGQVIYFELFNGNIVISMVDNAALETASVAVIDRQDPATSSGEGDYSTNGMALVSGLMFDDDDGKDSMESMDSVTHTWQYSINGRGGWIDFDDDTDATNNDESITITTGSVAIGKYVRLVITFNDDGGVAERVESDAIKVGAIATLAAIPAITGLAMGETTAPVGRTLKVDAPAGASVQWLANGMAITGATGAEFTVMAAQQGAMITVQITSLTGGNATSIVTTAAVNVVAGQANSGPVAPNLSHIVDLGAAPDEDGEFVHHVTTVDRASLFDDVEGGLTFSYASPSNFAADEVTSAGSIEVYLDNDDGSDQLVIVDEETGLIRYYSTKSHTHDDGANDGEGNFVTMVLTATDADAGATATVNVQLRIDVAGTGSQVNGQVPIAENVIATATAALNVATLNILDENMRDHVYGQYDWSVNHASLEVVPDRMDGSMATLRVKTGSSLDYEATRAGSLVVMVTATPNSGNFDPITITVTITVTDDEADNVTPQVFGSNVVPGLEDNEDEADTDDDTKDSDDDDDDDGGDPAPPDAMAAFAAMLDDGLF